MGVPAEVEPTAPRSSAASPSCWRGLFFVLVATERAWLSPATRDLLALGVGGLASFAIVGGFATPVLLGTLGKESTATLFGYVLVLDVATLALGQLRGWRAALPAAGRNDRAAVRLVRDQLLQSGAALDRRADRRIVRRPVHGHRRAKEALVGWQQRLRSRLLGEHDSCETVAALQYALGTGILALLFGGTNAAVLSQFAEPGELIRIVNDRPQARDLCLFVAFVLKVFLYDLGALTGLSRVGPVSSASRWRSWASPCFTRGCSGREAPRSIPCSIMTPPDRTESESTAAALPPEEAPGKATYADWRRRVEAELGPGRDFEKSLVTTTLEGLEIAPLYVARDSRQAASFELDSGGWAIATEIAHPAAAHANADLLEDLQEGATAASIRLGTAGRGVSGESSGVDVVDLGSLDRLLDGVYLDAIPVVFESSANALPLAATFAALCEERDADFENTRVEFSMDPIGALARDGALPGDMEDAKAELCSLAKYSRIKLNHGRSIAVDASVWHRAGGHAAQELGFALATFVEYLRWLEDDGLTPAQAHPEFAWRFDIGRDVFTEIAKLRAARELYARVLGAMGIKECAPLKLSAITSPRGLAKRDPWTNMLRTSLGVFAGAVGGADMITALAFDEPACLPSPLGRRNARNTQLILAHESRLEHVGDPARGAYYVEARTSELCDAAWNIFVAVEERGGMVSALDSGWIASELDRSRAELHARIAHRRWPLVGVSEYPGAPLDEDGERRSADRQETLASRAATAKRLAARGTISIGAIDGFPHGREAALQGATIEEIGSALIRGASQTMTPLPSFREASVFERLVEAAGELPAPPRVFVACLGPLAQHTARAGFATQLLLAGGFEVVQSEAGLSSEALGRAAQAAGAKLVCLAGSDDDYASPMALKALAALRSGGAREVWIAAPPKRAAAPLEKAGLDGHLFMGCDAEAVLSKLLRSAGANLSEASQ